MSSFGKFSNWKKPLLKHCFFLQHCTEFFLFFFLFLILFASSFPLRAGGETMIRSSWFYVKFKYAEKVSQYVCFCPKGNLPPPLESSHLTGSSGYRGSEWAWKCYLWMCFLWLNDSWTKHSLCACIQTLLLTKRKESLQALFQRHYLEIKEEK